MRTLIILASLSLYTYSAKAEFLMCIFSNPSLVVHYNGALNQVAILEPGHQIDEAGIINSTQLYVTGLGQMEVQTIHGSKILSLKHTPNEVYPFEAEYTYPFDASKAPSTDQNILKNQKGVCESAFLKKKT